MNVATQTGAATDVKLENSWSHLEDIFWDNNYGTSLAADVSEAWLQLLFLSQKGPLNTLGKKLYSESDYKG